MARDMRSERCMWRARGRARMPAILCPNAGRPERPSTGNALMTPSRVNIHPARISRKAAEKLLMPRCPVPDPVSSQARSKLPAGMERGNAAGEIAIADALETSLLDHRRKILLLGEFADRLDQIAVGIRVARNHLADARNSVERPLVINLVENRQFDLGEFEAQEPTARLQHTIGFGQRLVDMRHIANAESNRIGIEAVVLERQFFGIGLDEFEIVGKALLDRPFTPDAQHRAVDIENGDMGLTAGSLDDAESDIAGAASNVERGP